MKKILLALPLGLLLFACNDDDDFVVENNLIEAIEPSIEGDVNVDEIDDDGIKKICGNRWDCTKVAPRTGDDNKDKSSEIIKSTQILNVK